MTDEFAFTKIASGGRLDFRGKTVAWINSGIVFFPKEETEICESYWREWLDTCELKPKISERDFSKTVVSYLTSIGFSCSCEVITSFGRIDILAVSASETRIIECKIGVNIGSMSSALGQLLFYKDAYRNASLFIATPEAPPKNVIDFLKSVGVTCLVIGA